MPFRLNRTENEPHFNPRDLRPAIINSIIPENIFIRNLFALKLKNPIMFSRRSLILPPNSVSFSFLNVIYLGGGTLPPSCNYNNAATFQMLVHDDIVPSLKYRRD